MHKKGLEFAVPLHRMISSNDLYTQVDGAKGTGPKGRVYSPARGHGGWGRL